MAARDDRQHHSLSIDIGENEDVGPPLSPASQALRTLQHLTEQQQSRNDERYRKMQENDTKLQILMNKVEAEGTELNRLTAARERLNSEERRRAASTHNYVTPTITYSPRAAAINNGSWSPRSVEKKEPPKKKDPDPVSYWGMLRVATGADLAYFIFGVLGAIGAGAMMPVFLWFFKDILNDGFAAGGAASDKVLTLSYYFLVIGAIQGVFGAIEVACLTMCAERQGMKLKEAYLRAILRQDQSWYDLTQVESINSSMERDTINVQDAIGHKTGQFVRQMAIVLGGLGIAFARGWQMTLVCLATAPLMAIIAGWLTKTLHDFATAGEKAYAAAGAVAEQAISGIRTVVSLSGHDMEVDRYVAQLGSALQMGLKKARNNGLGMGTMQGVMLGSYALAMWFGGWLITNEIRTPEGHLFTGGDVMLVF